MKRKKARPLKRRAVSAGTLVMLLLTAGVLLCCAGFFAMISGKTLQSRAAEMVQLARQSGVSLISEEESARLGQEQRQQDAKSMPAPAQEQLTPSPAPRAQGVTTFTLAAAGTVAAPKPIRSSAQTSTGEYDFGAVFSGLGDVLSGADLAIATLETMTAGENKGYGGYNAPAQLLDGLRDAGVDLLSLGTEHALDKGLDGLEITVGELTARGLAFAGCGGEATLFGIGGVQVAVLAYTYGLSEEGKAAAQDACAVSLIDAQAMAQDIVKARADGANVVIVLPHWGTKNKQETPEEVRQLARALAKAGADVILGTHPNVVQGTERLRVTRADGLEYETVVCYSLGSLLTDARTEENTAGMVARLSISYDPAARRVHLGSLACLPVYTARGKADGQAVYRVIDVENAQAMEKLSSAQQEAALAAAAHVRRITGQSDMEDEGEG